MSTGVPARVGMQRVTEPPDVSPVSLGPKHPVSLEDEDHKSVACALANEAKCLLLVGLAATLEGPDSGDSGT